MQITRHFIEAEYVSRFVSECKYPCVFYRPKGKVCFDRHYDNGWSHRFVSDDPKRAPWTANPSDVVRVEVKVPEHDDHTDIYMHQIT